MRYVDDQRIVLTLDAGGTNFVFSAIRSNREIVEPVRISAETEDLGCSLATIESGFKQVMDRLDEQPAAISFAFPGPADYPNGIVDNVGNLPEFRGGVPLGPWLEKHFAMPVFINNDGDLFVYGEAIAGLLPEVNRMLKAAGSPKRYQILFGITLGTGFGGGLVVKDQLYIGDNSNGIEVWLMRNKVKSDCLAEDGASIRAVRNSYARNAGVEPDTAPNPKEIEAIAMGELKGDTAAAREAYRELGEVVGDALANAMTLFDGLVVIGGGLSKAHRLFMPAVLNELNGQISNYEGALFDRIVQRAYNLEDPGQVAEFVRGDVREIKIPGSEETLAYDPLKRIGIGTTVLGTSASVSIGAYAYALNQLDS